MTHNVLVIGAGVAGLSAGLALLARGHRVTVIDRGPVGGESSWAGGGILSPLQPWNYPEQVLALALPSMVGYEAWVRKIEAVSGRDAEFWRCGMRVFDVELPDEVIAWCARHELAAEVAPDAGARTLWLPNVAQVRNPRLVRAMCGALTSLGGRIYPECHVEHIAAERRLITEVQTTLGKLSADRVVLATGAWAELPLTGSRVNEEVYLSPVPNIRPIRGQMLLFKLAPGVLDTILYRNGLYLIPRRDGHVLVGSTLEDVGFDKSTDDATLRRLHVEAAELLPALRDAQPIRHWAGLRPGSPDNIPVIDRHPDFDNVYINAGHYRYGVTLAPASSELLADLIEGKVPAVDPAPYEWAAAAQRRW